MLNIIDFFTGRILSTKPGGGPKRPPCAPDIPRDPEPVRPPEPFCTTGPDLSRVGEKLDKTLKKKKR